MNKSFLALLIIGLLWSGITAFRISGTDFTDEYFEGDVEKDVIETGENRDEAAKKLVETCLIQIIGPSVSCIMRSLTKWNVNPYQLKSEVNHGPTCCSIWEMTDCLKRNAKVFCSEDENTAFETNMKEQTALRNVKNCSHFQYKTDYCMDGLQVSNKLPVLNKVTFRENNNVIDNEQLAEEIQPKNSFSGFSKVHSGSNKVFKVERTLQDALLDESSSLDEIALAQRLLNRVDRITINQMVIDLHPVKGTDSVSKQETDSYR